MKVLITGFEPYWDYPENSSWVVAEEVATRDVEGVDVACERYLILYSLLLEQY
jgi:pyroglutamyl-peptidase